MATVQFVLRDPNAEVETPIHLIFYYDQSMIKLSTGKVINPDQWNKDTRLAKETQRYKVHEKLNNDLKLLRNDILAVFDQHQKRNKNVFLTELKEEIKQIIHPKPIREPEKMTFFKGIDEYIKTVNRSPRTKLSYTATKHILERYCTKMLKKELDFDSIGIEFYNDFQRYCYQVEKKAKNTFGGHIKNIKVFMNYMNDKGYTTNTGHKHTNFKKLEETSDTIYLNDNELETLYNLDLSDNPKLDRVRDLFIIGCQTGLRYSDLSQLTEKNITEGGTRLTITTVKTGERVVIPLHWQVRAILQKYGGVPPRAISNQKMNEYIKLIAKKEEAKLTESINQTITRGGFQVSTNLKKWQLITIHTSRRSFATNMFLADVPSISIMKITGHRTEKSFLKYIKITQEQNADKLATHPRFQQSPLRVVNE